ncbi:gliding motility-associated C-terminal domain-containing protein [Hymenobacter latericus]|uniref:gliding motility-associated C-terminal domain-containing protein n=1 Tax=Hymenobacter sp. YIM 151858-1 TaxID=2987688 RepID=UPI002225F44B|nr:gliding motility-associated C-terminal domain-containing protein [Hymenobacter sp. YIM 151858-1]UYZ60347.1 gliding motility-associated C-terminal domain-containing protein [Hymenobacter sp. YIM 151858-1]
MILYRYFLLLLLLLLLVPRARATHIVGGELDLQYQSGSMYRLTLTLYFDAINGSTGALDNDATAGIFERGSNRRVRDVTLPLVGNTFVPYTNVACTIGSLSTRRLVYSSLIEMTPAQYGAASGYYVAVERCCRNGVINNIALPGDAGQTYYLEFPAVVRNGQAFRNSSPRIFPPLSDYACINELFYFDFGGQDADGDSLVYEMATPLNGHANTLIPRPEQAQPAPYREITWLPGLSVNNQMPGAPTLSVGRTTGRLTVRPTRQGLFVFAVKCSEYRRGLKIGEVRRDFQLLVINCPRNQTPQLVVRPPGTPRGTYREGRDTLRLRAGQNRCLRFNFTDVDPASALQLELRAINFPQNLVPAPTLRQGTVRAPGQPDTLTSEICFPECFSSGGKVFLLDVIVADNGCSLPRRDTVRVAFTADAPPNQLPTVAWVGAAPPLPVQAKVGDLLEFEILGLDADLDAVTLELTGRGFTPAQVGAQLVAVSNAPGRSVARFRWQVDCRAVERGLHEFQIIAAANPCQQRQASAPLLLPVQVNYRNAAPRLATTFPPASPSPADPPVVIRMRLGGVYEATLDGTDPDLDGLTLTAAGTNFELAAMGMSMSSSGSPGSATGKFRWQASCAGVNQEPLEVTFTLADNTCRPVPQQRVVRFEVERPTAPEFLPPNVFTPNNDGRNDYFELPTLPPDFCEQRFASVTVFSRWGNKVYRSADRTFRWNGKGVPEGVYYYLVEYTDGRAFKGTVTVIP